MGSSVFLACILMMVIFNCPLIQKRIQHSSSHLLHSDGSVEKWVISLRVLSSMILGFLPLLMYALWLAS